MEDLGQGACATVQQVGEESPQPARGEDGVAAEERVEGPPAEFVHVLGGQFLGRELRAGREMGDPVQMDVVDLAVPAGHREDRGLRPHLVAEFGDGQAHLLAELAEHGIAFGLAEMPRLATLVAEVARGDAERRSRALVAVMSTKPDRVDDLEEASSDARGTAAFMGAAR